MKFTNTLAAKSHKNLRLASESLTKLVVAEVSAGNVAGPEFQELAGMLEGTKKLMTSLESSFGETESNSEKAEESPKAKK